MPNVSIAQNAGAATIHPLGRRATFANIKVSDGTDQTTVANPNSDTRGASAYQR